MILIFFFQAEDGIRDSSVTGVQTCALPILSMNGACCSTAHVLIRSYNRPGIPSPCNAMRLQYSRGKTEETGGSIFRLILSWPGRISLRSNPLRLRGNLLHL